MAALFARLWLSRSVTDPVGLTVAKPFRTPNRYAQMDNVSAAAASTERSFWSGYCAYRSCDMTVAGHP